MSLLHSFPFAHSLYLELCSHLCSSVYINPCKLSTGSPVLISSICYNPLFFSPFPSIFPLFLPFSLNSPLVLAPLFHYHMPSSPLLFAMTLTLPRAESPLFIISTHCDLLARLTRDSDATHLDSLYAPFPLTHSLSVVYINPVNYL